MAETQALTYIGTPDDFTDSVTIDGVEFPKGKSVSVKDKALYEKYKDNPTFTTDAGEAKDAADAADDSAKGRLIRLLVSKHVEYDARWGVDKLQKALDDALLEEAKDQVDNQQIVLNRDMSSK